MVCLVSPFVYVKSESSFIIIMLSLGNVLRFIYGKPDVPKPSPEIISEVHDTLLDFQTDHNWDAAVEFVVNAGDQKASSLARNDWYRLKRSLEILKV